MRAVIVGAGMAGLGGALALARDGHEVTLVERDDTPMPDTADAAFLGWERRGAPQVRHSHAFLARLHNILKSRAPDVLEALLANGATELPFTQNLPETLTDRSPMPGDEELVALACRRTTFEWVLRRLVLAEPGVMLRHGETAEGLVANTGNGVPRVRGVALRDAAGDVHTLDADLVVDARGPRSTSDDWLAAIGAHPVPEELHESGIVYFSRFYRMVDGADFPAAAGPVAGDTGYVKFAVFQGDNHAFSVTFAVDVNDDKLRRALGQVEPFEAAALSLDTIAPWRAPGVSEPLTEVHVMAGLRNRHRPFVVDGEPLALGFVPLGDAAVCTNPLYGRGCSLAFVHGYGLADALREHPDNLHAATLAFSEFTHAELYPWFRGAVMQDEQARALAEAQARGEVAAADAPAEATQDAAGEDPNALMRSVFRDGLAPALRTSPIVFRAFLRWFNLLATPDALMSDPAVIAEVMAAYQSRHERPPEPPIGPPRRKFEAAVLAS